MPHIVDRFFRGEKRQAVQIFGTGLGLTIVRETVEPHSGQVLIESEVDVGTNFTIWVPCAARGVIPGRDET